MNEEQTTPESATETSTSSTPPATEAVADRTTERPEWLHEKFATPEDMRKSYDELSSKLGKRDEELTESITQKLQEEAFALRPAKAEDYIIPDSLNEEEAGSNPLLKEWADYAWENGYSQDEFSHWVNKFADYVKTNEPDLESEKKLLGDNANARLEAANLFIAKFFPEEFHDVIVELGSSAQGVKAVEFMQKQMQSASLDSNAAQPSKMTKEDIEAKMRDPRYYDPARRDKAYVQEVNDDFNRLYG